MSAADDSAAPVLAIIHAAGLKGFGAAGAGSNTRNSPTTADDAETVLAIVRAAGLPGFNGDPRPSTAPAPVHAERGSFVTSPFDASSEKLTAPAAGAKAAEGPRMSKREFAVLTVEPGHDAELANLESRLGRPLAAEVNGRPFWFGGAIEGKQARAFQFDRAQLPGLATLVGDLAAGVNLAVRSIPVDSFRIEGPGASPFLIDRNEAPQMPVGLPAALAKALGR